MSIGPLGTETVHAIGWTLLHFLWQGAAAAALLAAVNPLLRWSAELRYAAAATTSVGFCFSTPRATAIASVFMSRCEQSSAYGISTLTLSGSACAARR